MKIISADERLKSQAGIKGIIVGKAGVGKTSLLWTLEPEKTLFVNAEAGDLSVQDWAGDMVKLRTWQEARNLACVIGGPNPAYPETEERPQPKRISGAFEAWLTGYARPRNLVKSLPGAR